LMAAVAGVVTVTGAAAALLMALSLVKVWCGRVENAWG